VCKVLVVVKVCKALAECKETLAHKAPLEQAHKVPQVDKELQVLKALLE
jgi:hypothetical protein